MIELAYTGERAVPWNPATGGHIMQHHAMRYAWALQFVAGRRVVDLGSGAGYGAFMLSWTASEVLGVEKDPKSVAFARERFLASNLSYVEGDITQEVPDAEVYVAFEVLEHLDRPWSVARTIEGTLIWSVPVHDDSAFHRHVFSSSRAAGVFGGEIYWQSKQGAILPEGDAGFMPMYVLGVRA